MSKVQEKAFRERRFVRQRYQMLAPFNKPTDFFSKFKT
jgi:hypothetical protein